MPESEDQPVKGQSALDPEQTGKNRKGKPEARAIVNVCSYCKKPIYSDEEVIDAEPLYFHASHKSKEERVAIADIISNNLANMDAHQATAEKEADDAAPIQPVGAGIFAGGAGAMAADKAQPKKTVQAGASAPKKVNSAKEDAEKPVEKGKSTEETKPKKVQPATVDEEKPKKVEPAPEAKKVTSAIADEEKPQEQSKAVEEIESKKVETMTAAEEETQKTQDDSPKTVESTTTTTEDIHTHTINQEDGGYQYEPTKAKQSNIFDVIVDYVLILCGAGIAIIGVVNLILQIILILTKNNLDIYYWIGEIVLTIIIAYVGYRFYLYGRARKEEEQSEQSS